ncbi:MAG TPA: type VI secretion system-associated protein TagF [Aquabacterium sp.]|uniref:type VI secretion system-associated protein TagF n=1 Tax=Aquabacterium sp. TaxID=1872578 RepID=UPI002E2F4873|nr:type VI secretion system-associated protein TagF [Aquabacterium sp.]HEX5373947.1 type VI secretion system-associated protein TagF [Aquabacterium sp.]
MSGADTSATPGWYGKLPSTGDFASRRLSHELIEAWDRWLAEEIGELRQEYPDDWLQAYLDSPTWRFVLSAGLLGEAQPQAMAGILMPSVDRVGRYFPLSIMAPLPSLPQDAAQADALLNWLHALDDLAADVLQEDWPIDDMEQALARLTPPQWSTTDPALSQALSRLSAGDTRMVALPLPEARAAMVQTLGQALLGWGLQAPPQGALGRQMAPGLAWWWSDPQATHRERQTLLSRGLPSGQDFSVLLGSVHHNGMASSQDLGDTAPFDHPAA